MDFLKSLDGHSGSITALATVFLAVVTAGYVALTWRLLKGQHLGAKRELIEKLYTPLNGLLEEILAGSSPRSFLLWNQLKEREPFLAFHHLMNNKVRKELDRLADAISSRGGFEDEYWRLVESISLWAAARLEFDTKRVSGRPRLTIDSGAERLPLLANFLISTTSIGTMVRRWWLDREDGIVLTLLDEGRIVDQKKIPPESLLPIIEELRGDVIKDPGTQESLEQYHQLLRDVSQLQLIVRREIEKSSRL